MAASGKWIEGIGPDTTVADAARRSLELRLAVVSHALPLAAHLSEHDIEHVHRLRVATRRAAAALKLYRDWLPRKSARWVKKRLRQMRRAASEARDLDVLIERLTREDDSGAGPIVHFLEAKRIAVQPEIVELAKELRHDDEFIRKAARLVRKIANSDGDGHNGGPKKLRDWAPEQLARFRTELVDLIPDGSDDVAALHQFRIRCKALRYAIELLAPAFDPQLRKEVYPAVEELQERLGKITDHIAAMRLLAEWEVHKAEQTAEAGASTLDAEKAHQREDLDAFHEWWTAERATWLEQALAAHSESICEKREEQATT
jgi:CHAD domain-containing protein